MDLTLMFFSLLQGIGAKWLCLWKTGSEDSNKICSIQHITKLNNESHKIFVLRLGHRIDRDNRATMHVFLTARALGAIGVFYSGQRDESLEKRIREVVNVWGGSLEVQYIKNWKTVIKDWKKDGVVIHLTMYGIHINKCLDENPKNKKILVIVGSEKVPSDVFQLADFNIAVGNQPHSEIAALAIFLDRFYCGKELDIEFENARMKINPQKSGKRVILEP